MFGIVVLRFSSVQIERIMRAKERIQKEGKEECNAAVCHENRISDAFPKIAQGDEQNKISSFVLSRSNPSCVGLNFVGLKTCHSITVYELEQLSFNWHKSFDANPGWIEPKEKFDENKTFGF